MQGRELRGQPVGHTPSVAGAAPRRNRVLVLAAQARIEERARAVHLGRANVRVPVGDRAEPGPRVQVDAREAEGRWNERPGLLAIRPERLPVLVKLGVEAARPPACEHRLDGREIDAKEIGERFEVWRERHDRADVQVAVRPAVEAPTDAGGEGVVDGRMTEGALDADRSDAAERVEEARHAHDRIQLEERQGRRGVVEVYFACLEMFFQRMVQGVLVYLEADGQRGLRAYAAAHAAMLLAGDSFVELQRVAPERFIAERGESEDLSPVFEHLGRMVCDHLIKARLVEPRRVASRGHPGRRRDQGGDADQGHRESGTEDKWENRHMAVTPGGRSLRLGKLWGGECAVSYLAYLRGPGSTSGVIARSDQGRPGPPAASPSANSR